MQTVIWDPTEVNLATVKELEHFSVSVACYIEEDINNQIVKKYLVQCRSVAYRFSFKRVKK